MLQYWILVISCGQSCVKGRWGYPQDKLLLMDSLVHLLTLICWIAIYPMDNTICLLNNWALIFMQFFMNSMFNFHCLTPTRSLIPIFCFRFFVCLFCFLFVCLFCLFGFLRANCFFLFLFPLIVEEYNVSYCQLLSICLDLGWVFYLCMDKRRSVWIDLREG